MKIDFHFLRNELMISSDSNRHRESLSANFMFVHKPQVA